MRKEKGKRLPGKERRKGRRRSKKGGREKNYFTKFKKRKVSGRERETETERTGRHPPCLTPAINMKKSTITPLC